MKRSLSLLALVMGLIAPMVKADEAIIYDVHGHGHATGYIGPQKKLGLGGTKRYWVPTHAEVALAPTIYDARSYGGVNMVAPIKDQGQCGSCWDFSMTKTLESARLSAAKPYLNLAEQDPLVNDRSAYGCDGGFMDATYWVNHGLTDEGTCPYTASDTISCSGGVKDKGLAWGFIGAQGRAPTEDELKVAIFKYHVISITVAAGGPDWGGGDGGKMTSCRNTGINHMVNLVGYDCSAKTKTKKKCTFIGANSWGLEWGDRGFFYASQGCNQMASTEDSALFITHASK